MSIEEKAKAYDVALSIAKETYETQPVYRAWLEKMFPELRESEDERIRKGLIEVVSDIAGGWPFEEHRITKKEALAYLERQKEQKPVDEEELSKFCEANFNAGKRVVLNNPEEYGLQKPAWSKDEKVLDYLIELIYRSDEDIFPERGGVSKLDVLTYLERQKEWKPIFKEGDRVIWDGEEFNILDVHKGAYNVGGYIVPFSRERELHPIGQKPAEWSEEDEKHINIILRVLDRQQCWDGATGKKFNPYQGEIDWLKSPRPRPSWKPSEEQMKWLKDVIETVPMSCRQQQQLESLYADLQKLDMESMHRTE